MKNKMYGLVYYRGYYPLWQEMKLYTTYEKALTKRNSIIKALTNNEIFVNYIYENFDMKVFDETGNYSKEFTDIVLNGKEIIYIDEIPDIESFELEE